MAQIRSPYFVLVFSFVSLFSIMVYGIKGSTLHEKYHYLRELVQDKEVNMEYVGTKEKIANIFTKVLPKDVHKYLRCKLGVISLSKAI